MTDCEEIRSLRAFRALSVLEDEEQARVDAHEASCPACHADASSLEEACRLVGEIGGKRRPPPANVWKEIARSLEKPLEDEVDAARAVSAIRIALDCSYCHGKLGRSEAVYCASCLAPHHEECFREHRRCSTYGCDETRLVRPQETAEAPRPRAPRERRSRRPHPLLLLAGVAALGSVAALTWRAERAKPVVKATARPKPPAPARFVLVHAPPSLTGEVYRDRVVLHAVKSDKDAFVRVTLMRVDRLMGDSPSIVDIAGRWTPTSNGWDFVDTAPVASATYRYIERVEPDTGDLREWSFPTAEAPEVQTATWSVPDRPDEVWFQRGLENVKAGKLEEAEAGFSEAIALAPRVAVYWLERGKLKLPISRRQDEALADLTTSLQLDHTNPEAWIARARLLLEDRKPEAALDDADEAVRLAPGLVAAWKARADVRGHMTGASYDRAALLADLRRVLELEPHSATAWRDVIYHQDWRDPAAMLADLDKAVAACDPDDELFYQRSLVQPDPGRALEDVERAIALKASDRYWFWRTELKARARDWRGVEESATRTLEAYEHGTGARTLGVRTGALALRGEARLRLGDLAGTILDADEVLHEEPESPSGFRLRGLAQAARGNAKAAVSDLQRFLELDAKDDRQRESLGERKVELDPKDGHLKAEVEARLAELKGAGR